MLVLAQKGKGKKNKKSNIKNKKFLSWCMSLVTKRKEVKGIVYRRRYLLMGVCTSEK
jgi:hypothetical protein